MRRSTRARRRTFLLALALLSALCGALAPARAARADAGGDATVASGDVDAAIARGHAGRRLFEGGDFEAALAEFRRARALVYSPVFALYEARCLRALGRWTAAADVLRAVAAEPEAPQAPAQWRDARRAAAGELVEIEAALPRLRLRPPDGQPASSSSEQLLLDGAPVRATGEHRIDPGVHRVQCPGTPVFRDLRLAPGETADVSLACAALTPPAPAATAATTTAATITAALPSRAPATTSTRAHDTDTDSARRRARYTTLGWTALAIGAAAVATGAVTGAMVWSEARALDGICAPPAMCNDAQLLDAQERKRDADRLSTVSTVAWAAGGAFTAAAVVLFVLRPPGDLPPRAPPTVFAITPGGVSFTARF